MVRKKLGRVLERTHRQGYNNRENPLPEELAFLAGVPFYAVTKVLPHDSERMQIRVEILPRSLRKLTEESNNATALREKCEKLEVQLSEAKREVRAKDEQISALKYNNKVLMENIDSTEDAPRSGIKSNMQLAHERGFQPYGLPLQGGLPGLGKKR